MRCAESLPVPDAVTIDGVTHRNGEPSSELTVCGLSYKIKFAAFPRGAVVTCTRCLAQTKGRW